MEQEKQTMLRENEQHVEEFLSRYNRATHHPKFLKKHQQQHQQQQQQQQQNQPNHPPHFYTDSSSTSMSSMASKDGAFQQLRQPQSQLRSTGKSSKSRAANGQKQQKQQQQQQQHRHQLRLPSRPPDGMLVDQVDEMILEGTRKEEARGLWGYDTQGVSQDIMSFRFSSSDQDVSTFSHPHNHEQPLPNRKRGKFQKQQNQPSSHNKKQKHQMKQAQSLLTVSNNVVSSASSSLNPHHHQPQPQFQLDYLACFSSADPYSDNLDDAPPSLGWVPASSTSRDDRRGAIKFVSAGITSFNTLANQTAQNDDSMKSEYSPAPFTQKTSVPSGLDITDDTTSKTRPMRARQGPNRSGLSQLNPAPVSQPILLQQNATNSPQLSTTESLHYSSDDERSESDDTDQPMQPQLQQHDIKPASEFMNIDLLTLDPIIENDNTSESSAEESSENSDETDSDEAVDEWEDVGGNVVSTSPENDGAVHRGSSSSASVPGASLRIPETPKSEFTYNSNMTKTEIQKRLIQIIHPDLMHKDLMIEWALLYLKPPDPSSGEYAVGSYAFANRTPPSYFKQVMDQLCSGQFTSKLPPMDHEFRSHIHIFYHEEGGSCHGKGKEAKLVLRQGRREPDAFANQNRHIVLTKPPPKKIRMSEYMIDQHIEELEENIRELEQLAQTLVTHGIMFVSPTEQEKLKRKRLREQRKQERKLNANTAKSAMQRLQSAAPIASSNIGYQLLKAHGWKEGAGIGRQQSDSSVIIPVTTVGRRGLGHGRK